MLERKRILVTGTLPEGVGRDEFVRWVDQHGVSADGWELVRTGVLLEPMFKTGDSVGLVGFMDCDTEADALRLLAELPVVSEGILEFTAERVSRIARFD